MDPWRGQGGGGGGGGATWHARADVGPPTPLCYGGVELGAQPGAGKEDNRSALVRQAKLQGAQEGRGSASVLDCEGGLAWWKLWWIAAGGPEADWWQRGFRGRQPRPGARERKQVPGRGRLRADEAVTEDDSLVQRGRRCREARGAAHSTLWVSTDMLVTPGTVKSKSGMLCLENRREPSGLSVLGFVTQKEAAAVAVAQQRQPLLDCIRAFSEKAAAAAAAAAAAGGGGNSALQTKAGRTRASGQTGGQSRRGRRRRGRGHGPWRRRGQSLRPDQGSETGLRGGGIADKS